MANTHYHDNGLKADPIYIGSVSDKSSSTCISSREILAQQAIYETDDDSRSRGAGSERCLSDTAQQNEAKTREETSEESTDRVFESPANIAQRLNTIVLSHEAVFFETESTVQVCHCACHDWSFEEGLVSPQSQHGLTMPERWEGQGPSKEPTVPYWKHRINVLPCRSCCCYGSMDDDILEEKELGSLPDDP